MQPIDSALVTQELNAAHNARVEQISYKDLHDAYIADGNPNKGTEEDYIERFLANGWRRAPAGDGIWCVSSPQVSGVPAVNTPDPSLFEPRGYPALHDDAGSPEAIAHNRNDAVPQKLAVQPLSRSPETEAGNVTAVPTRAHAVDAGNTIGVGDAVPRHTSADGSTMDVIADTKDPGMAPARDTGTSASNAPPIEKKKRSLF